MNNQPLVSVLMTAYNREQFIGDAIESVLASTFQDYELIIIDDCSSDRTVEIADAYTRIDKRVKVVLNEQNLGDYPNRNRAATYAMGKYLKYHDSDDILYPHALDVMVKGMEKFPHAGYGFASAFTQQDVPYPFLVSQEDAYKKHFFGHAIGFFYTGPGACIIKKDAFLNVGGFTNEKLIGDLDLWYKLASAYPVVELQASLSWWRRHEGQEYNSQDSKVFYRSNRFNLALKYLNSDNCPLNSIDKTAAIRRLKKGHSRRMIRSLINMEVKQYITLSRNTKFSFNEVLSNVI